MSGVVAPLSLPESGLAYHGECWDGLDNDNDGKFDFPEDTDCTSLDDTDEGPASRALFVDITDGRDEVRPGDSVVYVITLRQQRDERREVTVDMHLPPEANIVDANEGGQIHDGTIRWHKVTVERNVVKRLTVSVHVRHTSTIDKLLIARVLAENVQATDTTQLKGTNIPYDYASRLSLSISDNQDYAQPSSVLTYNVRLRNISSDSVSTTLRVGEPEFTSLVGVPAGAEVVNDTIYWRNISLQPNEERVFTFQATVQSRTHENVSLFARAIASGVSATDRTIIRRRGFAPNDLSVSINDGRRTVERDQFLTYVIYVQNRSPYPAVDPIITASTSTFADFVEADEGGRWDGKNVRWPGLEIAANGTRKLSYTIRVRRDADIGGQIIGGVEVIDAAGIESSNVVADLDRTDIVQHSNETADRTDRPTTSSSSRRSVNVATTIRDTGSDSVIRLTPDRSEALAGGRIRYTISVRNTLDRPIGGQTVSVRYDPTALRYVSSDNASLVVDGNIQWTLPQIAPGGTWETTYILAVNDGVLNGTSVSTVATLTGGDIGGSAGSRVATSQVRVISTLPQTGAPFDLLATIAASISGLSAGMALFRKSLLA